MPGKSFRDRNLEKLSRLADADVVVLGGGVNGVATFRDLALNGVSAVLLDKGDFCAGASGASSRMAHGGLRYLEGREFRLVAESARERNRLIEQASHLVRPLEIVVPLESWTRGFGRAVARFAGLSDRGGPLSFLALEGALMLYELLGRRGRALPRHGIRIRRRRFPAGLSKQTNAVVSYFDGQITQPEGLVLEMLGEALTVSDRTAALNHVDWTFDGSKFDVTDRLHGVRRTVRPKLIVNATGAWIDRVNARIGCPTSYLRGVKGAHLVLDNADLRERMAGRAFYFDDGTGRMVIVLPVGDRTLLGTTEVETANADDRTIAGEEIDYLLRAINQLFRDIPVKRSDIVAMTTGIRPLCADATASPTRAARDHSLEQDRLPASETPVLSLVGGKWTTFRSFAEEASDRALALLQMPRRVSTARRGYPGAAPCTISQIAKAGNLSRIRAEALLARYGAVGREVAAFCSMREDAPIAGAEDYTTAEIEWLVLERAACTVEDIVLRRTQLFLAADLTHATLQSIGGILKACLDRDPDEIAEETLAALADPRIVGAAAERRVVA
ncbi:FAD-dependent oxidoreductase [Chelativorans sp. AA-79]|uniref:glycerol-3-phosphate dehydrogenase/oxidase n=1 Tax=Chelativorans sp. AA-79 TaxID=3028735 RepID=UPI0023F66A5F|nr:FAD-dependent oxidoreductase [Chelativorans sp. AA-79]WEX08644.1 FAD-dependent oxidoreductase [Chelativorans sp. AA-79]